MPELIWDAKYQDGKRAGPVRIALPFQTVETVNESAQDRQRSLELFSSGRESEWRNRLIWGDKKYVLPSLLAEFAGQPTTRASCVSHEVGFSSANDRHGRDASVWQMQDLMRGPSSAPPFSEDFEDWLRPRAFGRQPVAEGAGVAGYW